MNAGSCAVAERACELEIRDPTTAAQSIPSTLPLSDTMIAA